MRKDSLTSDTEPVCVRFPMKGEWCPVNTPGHIVPSHGTDMLGQRFAYDFLQIDWDVKKGFRWYRSSRWKALLLGVDLDDAYCWSQPIYSPFDAQVVESRDGWAERNPAYFVRDLFVAIKNGLLLKPSSNASLVPALGNYLILKRDDIYCLIAHARCGSLLVKGGENVVEGQKLAEVGHSGNSTAPHLHFQLMDNPDLSASSGIPCAFHCYETFANEKWVRVENGIPGRRERIRT